MAQTLKLKRSAVSGNTPTTSDLALGEIAINTYDGNIFIKKDDGTEAIVTFEPGGTGNAGTIEEDNFTGNGSTTAFTLSSAPSSEENLLVFVEAAFQNRDSFTISGTTITFDDAPDTGTSVRVFHVIPGSVDDGILTVAKFAASAIVTEAEGISSNDNDTTLPTSAAVKDYVDSQVATADTLSEVLANGNTTGGTNIAFADNDKAIFGTGSDLEIFHNGTTSYIRDVGDGDLQLFATDDVYIRGYATNNYMARFNENGAVTLYHNNSPKLATTSTGIDVTGVITTDGLTTTGNINFGDGDKAIFGAGSDLEIYHDGSNSYIKEKGNGVLNISGGNAINFLTGNTADETGLTIGTDGAVTLYHNNSPKLATTATGINVTGTANANALSITEGQLVGSSGNLQLESTTTGLIYDAANGYHTFRRNGSNVLQINGATGDISFYEDTGTTAKMIWDASADALTFTDNTKAIFGAGSDLQIYHDGSNSYVSDVGTGSLILRGNNLFLQNGDGSQDYITCSNGGAINIKHAGSPKLATTSTGINVTGNIGVSGTVDGVDIAARNSVLTTTTTTANAALPKTGGAMTGAITTNSTFDGRDVATDGTKLDTIETSATADQTQAEINALGITATGLSGTPNVAVGTISSGNITTTGYLRGPSTFTIDPATHGDDTGTLVIAGNLQVDGTTTTINSTSMSVDDLNLTLASGAANAAAANGAGLTVAGASANFVYESTNDRWTLNKEVFSANGFMIGTTGTDVGLIKNSSGVFDFQAQSGREISFSNVTNGEHVRIDADGNVGIGISSGLTYPLTVQSDANNSYIHFVNSTTGSAYTDGSQIGVPSGSTDLLINNRESGNVRVFTSDTERMRIDSSGNVGIGTTALTNKFHVSGNARIEGNLMVGGAAASNVPARPIHVKSAGDAAAIRIEDTTSSNLVYDMRVTYGEGLHFINVTGGITPMTIGSSGNVGIGTTSPFATGGAAKLSVAGILSIGASNADMSYIRRQSAGNYAWQTYDNNNTGSIQLQPYGGNVGIGTTSPAAKLQVEEYGIDTTTTSTTATTQVAINSFAAATFRSARFTIQVTNSTDSTYHITEIILIHDGTTANITEYGTIFTGSAEATFDADISSGNVRLLATPASTDSMAFKVVAHTITT